MLCEVVWEDGVKRGRERGGFGEVGDLSCSLQGKKVLYVQNMAETIPGWAWALIGAGAVALIWLLYTIYSKVTFPLPPKDSRVPPRGDGVLEVYTTRPVLDMPISFSPFCAKLEAFVRLSKIPHKFRGADIRNAPNGKIPYVKHGEDGEKFGDSGLIVKYVTEHFASEDGSLGELTVHCPPGLERDWGAAEALALAAENELYFGLVWFRWVADNANWAMTRDAVLNRVPSFLHPIIRRDIWQSLWGQGMGRHSKDDAGWLSNRTIDAMERMLSDGREFLVGDIITPMDCAVFGPIQTAITQPHASPIGEHVRSDKGTRVRDWAARMQERIDRLE